MNWIAVTDALPNGQCLAFYKNPLGKNRTVKAFYADKYQYRQDPSEDYQDYNEADDEYYLPQGWYEVIDNWDDYASVEITEGVVTHWMPLPAPPN